MREQRVVDHVAVVAGDIGRRPDRIEDLQIRMHHDAQGRLGHGGRRRNRKARCTSGSKNDISEHFHFFHLHCRLKVPEFVARSLIHLPIEPRRSKPRGSISSSYWPAGSIPANDRARLTQYLHPAKSVIAFAGAGPRGRLRQNHQARNVPETRAGRLPPEAWTGVAHGAGTPAATTPFRSKLHPGGQARPCLPAHTLSAARFCFTNPAPFILVKHGHQEQSTQNREHP